MASPRSPTPSADPPGAASASATLHRYRFANAEFDESTNTLRVGGLPVTVEPLPLQLLAELLHRPNEVLTRAELFDTLWDGRPIVDHVLANAVSKLRRALGPEAAPCIVNLPRVGYRFTGALERVAVGRQQPIPAAFTVGRPVPHREDFRFERPLGAPGASIVASVWLARHTKLPTLRVFKFALDGDRLSALKREYTVYRLLRHELGDRPDFARVVDLNFTDPPYFLECEYGGEDLAAWAAEDDRLQGMNTPARVALFLQIARAVAAAHSVGVLHKDLKPANVLVDADGAGGWLIRLTDFGISRLLDPARLAELGVTAMGMTMTQGQAPPSGAGTPLFLAPELLAGQPPTMRSDLYALGLIFYQLLVGDFRRPITIGCEREIDDELLREDFAAATQGRPAQRLASVAELVERLERIEARRAERIAQRSAAERAEALAAQVRRTRARRPWVVAAVVSLCIGVSASLWFYARASAAYQRAEQESLRAQSINDFLNKDVLQSADVIRVGTTKTVTMLDVLNRASSNVAQRFDHQPRTQASVRRQLGDIYLRMFNQGEAQAQYETAIALLTPVVPPTDPEWRSLQFAVVRTLVGNDQHQKAEQRLAAAERSLAGAPPLSTDPSLDWLVTQARLEVAMDADRDKEALPLALHLTALADRLPASDLNARFDARLHLSELYARLGESEKAHALLDEITRPPYAEAAISEVLFANARLQRARQDINERRFDEAETLLIQVRDTLTRLFGPNELRVGKANSELADLYQILGRFNDADAPARAAVTAFGASLGEQHPYTVISKANLAINELDEGNPAAALHELDALRPKIVQNKRLATTVAGLDFARARALNDLGRASEALPVLDSIDARQLMESSWGPRDWQWKLQAEKGRTRILLGQREDGRALLQPAVAEMARLDSSEWELSRYRKVLATAADGSATTNRPKSAARVR